MFFLLIFKNLIPVKTYAGKKAATTTRTMLPYFADDSFSLCFMLILSVLIIIFVLILSLIAVLLLLDWFTAQL